MKDKSNCLHRKRKKKSFSNSDAFRVWKTNLFNSWYKLLGDVCSDGLVFKLQLGVKLRLQRLQNPNHLPVLPRAACLFLVCEVKP